MGISAIRSSVSRLVIAGAVLAAVGGAVLTNGGNATAQDATLVAGQTVITNSADVNLRSDATVDADVLTTLNDGTWATVVDGPVSADDYTWYQIDVDGLTGWAAGDFLVDSSDSIALLTVGTTVVSITDGLSFRATAGLDGEVLDSLGIGATATVLSGPAVVDDYSWYELDVDGVTGWAVRDYLAYAAGSVDSLTEGITARVNTDSVTLRAVAGVDAGVVDSLAGGAEVVVIGGSEVVDGFTWFNVQTDLGTGWVAGEYLIAA